MKEANSMEVDNLTRTVRYLWRKTQIVFTKPDVLHTVYLSSSLYARRIVTIYLDCTCTELLYLYRICDVTDVTEVSPVWKASILAVVKSWTVSVNSTNYQVSSHCWKVRTWLSVVLYSFPYPNHFLKWNIPDICNTSIQRTVMLPKNVLYVVLYTRTFFCKPGRWTRNWIELYYTVHLPKIW